MSVFVHIAFSFVHIASYVNNDGLMQNGQSPFFQVNFLQKAL
jgi:hypothetical protein